MKISARPLLVLHGNEAFRDRVRAVAGRRYQYQGVNGWPTLTDAVRESPPSALVIVDPFFDGDQRRVSPLLHAFTSEFPSIAVLAALKIGPATKHFLHELERYRAAPAQPPAESDG